jgi:PhnB protein
MILGVNPYLRFDGNAKEAVKFYENALEAENMGVSTFGEMPENPEFPLSEEMKERVMHAQLKVGNTLLMISDSIPGHPYQTGTQVDVALLLNDVEKTKEVFEKLQEGGEVVMPLGEVPWSPAYGQIKDKFGITWQITTMVE